MEARDEEALVDADVLASMGGAANGRVMGVVNGFLALKQASSKKAWRFRLLLVEVVLVEAAAVLFSLASSLLLTTSLAATSLVLLLLLSFMLLSVSSLLGIISR